MNSDVWCRYKGAEIINKTSVVRRMPTWSTPTDMDKLDFLESMLYTNHIAGRDSIRYKIGMDPV